MDNTEYEWIKRHRRALCPPCSDAKMPESYFLITAYCTKCRKVWRASRNVNEGTMSWFYLEKLNGTDIAGVIDELDKNNFKR